MNTWDDQLATAQQHLSDADPILARVIAQSGSCTIQPHTNYYSQLIRTVIGQQLSVKAAATIHGRFIDLFNGVVPTPEQILTADPQEIRATGCSNSKVAYIIDLAQHIVDGRLDLDAIATHSNETVIEQLVAVKGIGEWSAHMFMMFSLGRLDILPTGDLGIRKGMMQLYGLPELPAPAQMHELALKNGWAPYQTVASWYIWRSFDNEPI